MKVTRERHDGTRYDFDFGVCAGRFGWAQVDTAADASWYGRWAHPTRLMVFSFTEGDTCLVECRTAEEFRGELRQMDSWHRENHGRGIRIDPGLVPAITRAFRELGLGDLLHPEPAA